MKRPWGVHSIVNMFDEGTYEVYQGRIVKAVCAPYFTSPFERIRAAWWVITGRAHAVVWPKQGDLEKVIGYGKSN